MIQAARAEGTDVARHILEAARIRMQRADRAEALRLARMAAYAAPGADAVAAVADVARPCRRSIPKAEVQSTLRTLGEEIHEIPARQEILDDLIGHVEPAQRGE